MVTPICNDIDFFYIQMSESFEKEFQRAELCKNDPDWEHKQHTPRWVQSKEG